LENKWIQASLYDDVGWILDERRMKSIICVTRWRWPSLGSCMQLGVYSQQNKLLSCNCFAALVSQACSQSLCLRQPLRSRGCLWGLVTDKPIDNGSLESKVKCIHCMWWCQMILSHLARKICNHAFTHN
jgi:hypothetical protein